LLLDDNIHDVGGAGDNHQQLEAKKLLDIQKKVGFCYVEQDGVVIKELITDEVRDRKKKQEWVQRDSSQ
jgi:hypothetical protein